MCKITILNYFASQLFHFKLKTQGWWVRTFLFETNIFTTLLSISSRKTEHWCLVLLQVPKCFVLVHIFWSSPKVWLHLVPLQKLLCWHKNQFYWMQIIFLSGTKCLWLPQYVNKLLVLHKKFGPAQKNLGPVKGQVISEEINFATFDFLVRMNLVPNVSHTHKCYNPNLVT